MDGRTTDRQTPEHRYTISSPCEPNDSGELKSAWLAITNLATVHKKHDLFVTVWRIGYYIGGHFNIHIWAWSVSPSV